MRTIITYDITDDRKRYQIARALLPYAVRVQKSVFEAPELARSGYLRLRSTLERYLNPETDSLRYYRICSRCARN